MNQTSAYTPPPGSIVFERSRQVIESDFGVYRQAWVRDSRITGNALSIYLYINSHAAGFVVTRELVMKQLEIGKEAFNTACRRLEVAGYLQRGVQSQGANGKWGFDSVHNSGSIWWRYSSCISCG